MAIALSIGQIEGWVAQGFFPFARIGACLMVAPVFGARFVPARTRIILAVAITALVAPMIPTPAIAPFSPQAFTVVFQQLLIGVALGFALQIVFDALGLAGQLLANSMGLSFAFNVDPLRGSSTPALGQLYIILATLTFLALGGHAALIELLVGGLYSLPIGATIRRSPSGTARLVQTVAPLGSTTDTSLTAVTENDISFMVSRSAWAHERTARLMRVSSAWIEASSRVSASAITRRAATSRSDAACRSM